MADNKKTEIFNKVSEIVADHFDVDRAKITDDLNLKTDLDADSIDFVEFVLELEDTFGEEINDEDAEKLSTIGEVVDYIAEHTETHCMCQSACRWRGAEVEALELEAAAFFVEIFFYLIECRGGMVDVHSRSVGRKDIDERIET